jgi:hypothetical protein
MVNSFSLAFALITAASSFSFSSEEISSFTIVISLPSSSIKTSSLIVSGSSSPSFFSSVVVVTVSFFSPIASSRIVCLAKLILRYA